MKLTPEQQKVFAEWLRQKMAQHACTLCQANNWKLGEILVPASDNDDVLTDLDAPTVEMVQLICQNCGHVLLFDAHRIKDWDQHDSSHSALM